MLEYELKKVDNENNTFVKFEVLGLKPYERIIEEKLRLIVPESSTNEIEIPYSIANLAKLNFSESHDKSVYKLAYRQSFLKQIIVNQVLELILNGEIELIKVKGRYRILNGVAEDYFEDYIFKTEQTQLFDSNWIINGIKNGIDNDYKGYTHHSNIKRIIKSIIGNYIGILNNSSDIAIEILNKHLKKVSKQYDWITIEELDPNKIIKIYEKSRVDIQEEINQNLINGYLATEDLIKKTFGSIRELNKLEGDLHQMIENEMTQPE